MMGLKLLFSRYFRHRAALIAIAAFFAAMLAAVMIFHADPGLFEDGDGDYLICKIFALMPMVFCQILPTILMMPETIGSRFMRSVPCAEKMYTVGIPVFSVLIPAVTGALTNAVYAVFILLSGRDICNITDLLALTGIYGGIMAMATCVMMSSRFGGILLLLFQVPFWASLGTSINPDSHTAAYGFGLPLWAGTLIAVGGICAGALLGGVISAVCYRKCNFRETPYNNITAN